MRRLSAVLLSVVLVLALTACGHGYETATSAPVSTLEEVTEWLEQHTTTTTHADGTTTIEITTVTQKPTIPTRADTKTTRQVLNTTTTKKRTTTTWDNRSTVTVPVTTTTTTKAAAIPTRISTTTTTVAGETTTTAKDFEYTYSSAQQHTWLPMEQRYLYSLLSPEWQEGYRQIDEAVRHLDEMMITTLDLTGERGQQLYFLYMFDNPELFYLSGKQAIFSDGTNCGILFHYSVGSKRGEYCGYGEPLGKVNDALRQKIRQKQALFDSAVDAVISSVPADAPAAVKERMLYDYLILNADYNLSAVWDGRADDNWTAYGVLVNGTGVCESYSEAFQTLCNAVGILCTGVVGDAGGGHKWNAIYLDGDWYHCDVTFDDPLGGNGTVDHTYFNLTDRQMRWLQHTWVNADWSTPDQWPVPTCNGTRYSWHNFVRLYGK